MSAKTERNDSITSREMRTLEINSEYFGVPRLLLMENAGRAVAAEIASRFKPNKSVAIFCGLGGNGGDGFVVARHLSSIGFRTTVVLAGRAQEIADVSTQKNWNALRFLKEAIPIHEVYDSALVPQIAAEIVVDALLGTGSRGMLRPPIPQIVRKINAMEAFRVAVDIPTGIDSDTGEVLGEAVQADLTVTLYRTKKGLGKAKRYTGKLVIREIGLPKQFENFAGPGDVLVLTRSRPSESHKGDFGRLLVIGGNEVFSGAPALVALGAMRTGTDLVYVAAPHATAEAISSMSPDLITIKLKGEHLNLDNIHELEQYIEKADAVTIGPGLGLHLETANAVKALIKVIESSGKPMLLDADGLKVYSTFKRKLKVPLVLTPHVGEYATLTSKKLCGDMREKVVDVQETAEQLGAVILLKGATDIICDGKRFKLNFTGNPGMTVGGTGDVLSGIVGAFLAQKCDAFEAATAGAFVNGAAGDLVSEEKGHYMVASDLVERIPKVLTDPMSHLRVRKTGAGIA